MRPAIVAALLALSACATTQAEPPNPGIEVRYQQVKVPYAVPCVDRAKIPAEPPRVTGKLTGDARRDLDTVGASALRLRSWGVQLAALLVGCTKP